LRLGKQGKDARAGDDDGYETQTKTPTKTQTKKRFHFFYFNSLVIIL